MTKGITKLTLIFALLANTVLLMGCDDETNITSTQIDQVRSTKFIARETFSFSLNAANRSLFRLNAINGSVHIIEVTTPDSIRISGERIVGSESTSDAAAHLGELQVVVQDLAGEVFVKTTQPTQSEGRSYVVNYTITLPRNTDIVIKSVNGSINLDEIVGYVSVDLVNGEINSKVTLPVDGTVTMSLANGNIALDIPLSTSAQFEGRVANGSIVVSNLALQNRVETSRSLRGTLGDGRGTIALNSANGGIKVRGF